MKRHQKTLLLLVAGIVTLTSMTEVADAWPFRRRASISRGSGGPVRVAPKADTEFSNYRRLRAYYNYETASSDDVAFADRIRVFLRVQEPSVLEATEQVVAEVKITDLSDHESTQVKFIPVKFTEPQQGQEKLAVFDVTNNGQQTPLVQPAKVYRIYVNLHREADEYGPSTVFGHVPSPYYVATSGETRLERARRHVAMRTFREFYYKERGWRTGEQYRMDCHAFYLWAAGPCTVGSYNGTANLGRLFGGRTPYRNGGNISQLAQRAGIHGDYVRIPGHTFMLLAYDAKLGRVWTIEGNFGRTIEVAMRPPGSGWTVGHLAEEHIRPDLFEVASEAATTTFSSFSMEERPPGSS
jgi:hypothetical protein